MPTTQWFKYEERWEASIPVRSTPYAAPRRQPVSPFELVVIVVVLFAGESCSVRSRRRALFFEAILAFE